MDRVFGEYCVTIRYETLDPGGIVQNNAACMIVHDDTIDQTPIEIVGDCSRRRGENKKDGVVGVDGK